MDAGQHALGHQRGEHPPDRSAASVAVTSEATTRSDALRPVMRDRQQGAAAIRAELVPDAPMGMNVDQSPGVTSAAAVTQDSVSRERATYAARPA